MLQSMCFPGLACLHINVCVCERISLQFAMVKQSTEARCTGRSWGLGSFIASAHCNPDCVCHTVTLTVCAPPGIVLGCDGAGVQCARAQDSAQAELCDAVQQFAAGGLHKVEPGEDGARGACQGRHWTRGPQVSFFALDTRAEEIINTNDC